MTDQKALKRRVRERMTHTGERYTAARRQVLAKGDPLPPPDRPPLPRPPDGMTKDAVVRERTGRGWSEWFGLLGEWGAAARPHPEIARWLQDEHGVDDWWSQQLTVGYEIATGRRVPGQRSDGFATSASKTVAVPVERLFAAFVEADLRQRWLPDAPIEPRTARPHRTATFGWDDGASRLAVGFTAKAPGKSSVAVSHERLPDPETAAKMQAFWRERLVALRAQLEG